MPLKRGEVEGGCKEINHYDNSRLQVMEIGIWVLISTLSIVDKQRHM